MPIDNYLRYEKQPNSNGRQANLSAKTVNKQLSAINVFLEFCRERGTVLENPLAGEAFKMLWKRAPGAGENPRKALDDEQFKQLMQKVDLMEPRKQLAIHLLMNTGARISEMVCLRWNDFDFNPENPSVMIDEKKTAFDKHVTDKLKSKAARRKVYLWKTFAASVQPKVGNPSDFLFPSRAGQGNPIFTRTIEYWLVTISKELGFKITPHILRHTFAVQLAKMPEVTVKDMQTILGHESALVSMDIYAMYHPNERVLPD